MTAARAAANPSPARAAAPSPRFAADETRLGRVEVFASLAEARRDWAELEAIACASPYQTLAFAEAWFCAIGDVGGAQPLIVVARDESDAPSALLPLARFRRGPLGVAEFLGGRNANYNLGLFRPGRVWSEESLEALLAEAARAATGWVDLFALYNQPPDWQGFRNPLALLRGRPSPSFAYKSDLPLSLSAWRDARYSKAAQKKLRRGAERLAMMGAIAHVVARDEAQAARLLDAYFTQTRARANEGGPPNAYESPAGRAFLRRLTGGATAEGGAAMELHVLMLDDRVIATLGALPRGDRLSSLLVAYDRDPEIARCSPGKLLVHEVVGSAIEQGFATFDLGVGEARYKSECCESVEAPFDTFVATSVAGHAAALGLAFQRRLKGYFKRSPRMRTLAERLRNIRR